MELTPLIGFGLTLLGLILAFLLRSVFLLAMREKKPANGDADERRADMSAMKKAIYDTERDVREVRELAKGLAEAVTALKENSILQTSMLRRMENTHETVIQKLLSIKN